MNEGLANAIFGKVGFRGDTVKRYQAACILSAMQVFPGEFGADDVPNEFRPQDQTTAGCVFALMKSDGQKIFNRVGRRASKCATRKSAWINTYRIVMPIAIAWLKANGFEVPKQDQDVLAGQQLLIA